MTTIKLLTLADGTKSAECGKYVKEYDPSRPSETDPALSCHLVVTENRDEALQLSSAAAYHLWMSEDEREPNREDGLPNRPLTAFTVEFKK